MSLKEAKKGETVKVVSVDASDANVNRLCSMGILPGSDVQIVNNNLVAAAVVHLDGGNIKCKDWYVYVNLLHEAGGGTIYNKTEFEGIVWPIITCGCYTLKEKINYITAMKTYRRTPLYEQLDDFDYRKSITQIGIPVFFISGEYDYNCPWELVQEYCDVIDAPQKGFYKITGAAHSPLWENSEKTCEILKQIKEKTENE